MTRDENVKKWDSVVAFRFRGEVHIWMPTVHVMFELAEALCVLEKQEYVIDIPSVVRRFELRGTLCQPTHFMVAEENVRVRGSKRGSYCYSIDLLVECVVKQDE